MDIDFKIEEKEINSVSYFKLKTEHRKKILLGTKISETDKVYVYNYSKNKLFTFFVKNLNIVAVTNPYVSEEDYPYSFYDYMIGFEIDKTFLQGYQDDEFFVYIGKENPFAEKQLKHIVWKKIEFKDFPSSSISLKDIDYYKWGEYFTDETYKYETEELTYFLEELIAYYWGDYRVFAKRLLVFDAKTKEKVYEIIFYSSEGSKLAPLEYQWTGKLFKNKPIVIFGFELVVFDCPAIQFISQPKSYVIINCDNRH